MPDDTIRESTTYLVCWTQDDGVYACDHQHLTIGTALNCPHFIPDGGHFLRAQDHGSRMPRSLTDAERDIFEQEARCLRDWPARQVRVE